jgi:Tol biopolymer transport system component
MRLPRVVVAGAALVAAGLAILTFFVGQGIGASRQRHTPPPVNQTLTFRRGFLTGARFAPDGQTIVYSAAWDGKPSEIFTTRVGSAESRPLGIFPAGILAVSSQGEMAISLGCVNRWEPCFGTLARAPLAGGAPREVLDNVGSADWSPDGKELAVVHVVEGRDRLEYPIGKVLFESEGMIVSVRVSPRGDLVAFVEGSRRGPQVHGTIGVVDRSGRKRKLADTWSGWTPGYLLWNPGGDEVFVNLGTLHTPSIRGVSLSGRVRSASWIPGLSDVSREGRILNTGAYANMRTDMLALLPGFRRERNLSWLGGSDAADLSQDGRELLFNEGTGAAGIDMLTTTFLQKPDGSDAKQLGTGRAHALSPDARWALVVRTSPAPASPAPQLVLLPTGAGEPRPLPAGSRVVRYHWATFFPDGRRILFAAEVEGKGHQSYIQDVAGGPPRPFGEEGMLAMLVSPDGREIAGSTPEGLHLIYPADGVGRARPIDGVLPEDFLVQWSADAKSILVRGSEEQPLTVYRIELGTGRRELWKELSPPDLAGFYEYIYQGRGGLRVTPDLRYYVYSYRSCLENLTLTDLGPEWWK